MKAIDGSLRFEKEKSSPDYWKKSAAQRHAKIFRHRLTRAFKPITSTTNSCTRIISISTNQILLSNTRARTFQAQKHQKSSHIKPNISLSLSFIPFMHTAPYADCSSARADSRSHCNAAAADSARAVRWWAADIWRKCVAAWVFGCI